jgi:flagellar assembly factor FliW
MAGVNKVIILGNFELKKLNLCDIVEIFPLFSLMSLFSNLSFY